ncbi:hypothetical protein [Nocardiopsis baichengensis]|uniref:hypothetical protein n=1 Tax=Nocardiopsis baichengensis TaxID=280240 RepID=UPI00037FBA1C|nr:hypothetical protein [Nocardiopsis baichengensis]
MRSRSLAVTVPAAALMATPVLPFLRTGGLWFGLPPMLVWVVLWCLAVTPVLLFVERGADREEGGA